MDQARFTDKPCGVSAALQLTSPSVGDEWDLSKTNTIKWDSVSSDPTEFQLVLVDKSTTPETSIEIAEKVKTADGTYDLTNFVAKPGEKYSVKAYSTSKTNSGQLSESQTFEVTKSGGTLQTFACYDPARLLTRANRES